MSIKDQFTASEWQTLTFAPLWVFSAVAEVDGKIDNKELDALIKELKDALMYKNELAREVLATIAMDLEGTFRRYKADTRDITVGLGEAADILDRTVSNTESEGFKRTLLSIGIKVASASRKFLGPQVDDKEKAALVLCAMSLRVNVDNI